VTRAEPGRVLRLALIAWGLGHLALGRRATGAALLLLEVVALAALVILALTLARGTLDLVPFVAGLVFIGAWAAQAVHAYRSAGAPPADDAPTARTPAAAIALLSLPLLAWSSGYWLVAGEAASPAAVTDRFVADWTFDRMTDAAWPPAVHRVADRARARLDDLCAGGGLPAGCEAGGSELFRGVRWRIASDGAREASAIAEIVAYEQRPTTFLWVFTGSETVPVPIGELLTLKLEADVVDGPLPIEAREWRVRRATLG
jgi:hypothetical protein